MNRLLFFLEEKKQKKIICGTGILCAFAAFTNALRKTDGSYVNRLLFFLEEKKQKKIICRTATSLRSCLFHQPVAQNGRFVCEPSVFRSWQNVRESVFSQIDRLSRSVFCFFSSRKENVPFQEKKSYPLEEKDGGSVALTPPEWVRAPARASPSASPLCRGRSSERSRGSRSDKDA